MSEKTHYRTLAIHSQSTRPGSLYDFSSRTEQAYDSRALTLPNLAVVGLSNAIDPAYERYLKDVLKVNVPDSIVPEVSGISLSQRFLTDKKAPRKLRDKQQEVGMPFALSVFDVTDTERKLLDRLDQEIQIFPEVNFDQAVLLGNKAGFRSFCSKTGIPQFEGGIFSTIEDLKTFLADHPFTVVKHPVGTAGDGLNFTTPANPATKDNFTTWQKWMTHGKVVAEVFNPGGDEYSLHTYGDPVIKKGKTKGIYKQLAKKTDDGSLAHYGVMYPIANKAHLQRLTTLGEEQLIPALEKADYTGPACVDVIIDDSLSQPIHTMELNARAGANMYLHRMAEQVGESLYANPNVAFMSLVGLPHDTTSFAEFSEKFADVLAPKENGTLVLTNPGRHAFGSYDVMAISPHGVEEAEKILFDGIVQIWGRDKAEEFFAKIYQRS